jgi:hypothetical protein
MEAIIYVDNFRGFTDTYIPIKDVNFFVGENSTGKTSILSLLKLIGSMEFQYDHTFNTQEVKLGTFKDIYSGPKSTNPSFSIGYIVPRDEDIWEAILYTFEEKENRPALLKINIITKSGGVIAYVGKTPIKVKRMEVTSKELVLANILEIFRTWTVKLDDMTEFIKFNNKFSEHEFPFWYFLNLLIADKDKNFDRVENPSRLAQPAFVSRMVWIAPIRSKPKKTYDEFKLDYDSEGEHTPYLIKSLLKKKKTSTKFTRFIENFGKESGLFESLSIKGYGRDLASPFELRVLVGDLPLSLVNVGYGVSQALPIIVELYNRPSNSKFAIQQPEVHLHPKAQATLGDVIFELANNDNKKFFIETHSDYTIDRFRKNLRDKEPESKISGQVLFFSRSESGNKIQPILIMKNGAYTPDQPIDFREFFINESLDLLGI